MNILPKKSWHVRGRENVARVRRDEEQAAAAGRDAGRRAALAEQQARTEFLRKRARLSEHVDAQGPYIPPVGETPYHLDLFCDLEGVKEHSGGSTEYRAEMRQEKERREKALGILTYLGQSSAEAQTRPPWYTRPPARMEEQGEAQPSLKGLMDPLVAMKEMLRGGVCKGSWRVGLREVKGGRSREEREGQRIGSGEEREGPRVGSGAERGGWGCVAGEERGRRGVGLAEGRESQRMKSGAESRGREDGEGMGGRGTWDLRQERLRREAAERSRALALLSGEEGVRGTEASLEGEGEAVSFHSQFHPELSRQHRKRRR